MTHRFATAALANAAIVEQGGEPRVTHFAAGHTVRATGEEYYLIQALSAPLIGTGRPVRSERYVYTPSGKKRTSRELCGRVFKRFANDRAAFIAAAVELGVRVSTARAMFSHYTVGRYAA